MPNDKELLHNIPHSTVHGIYSFVDSKETLCHKALEGLQVSIYLVSVTCTNCLEHLKTDLEAKRHHFADKVFQSAAESLDSAHESLTKIKEELEK